MIDHPRVAALGETGLDRYWDFAPLSLQQEYIDRHLRLSQACDLPVILHCRDAQADLLAALRAAAANGPIHGVVHAFSGDAAFAAECLALGLYVSFAGNVTYSNKKFEPLRAAARTIPPTTGCWWRPIAPTWCRSCSAASRNATSRRTWSTRRRFWRSCGASRPSNSPPRPRQTPGGCSACPRRYNRLVPPDIQTTEAAYGQDR